MSGRGREVLCLRIQVPIFISEIAPPAIRGRLVGTYELGWQIGGLVGFWINYGMTQSVAYGRNQWLIPFAVQLIPAGMVLIGSLIFLRETPRWLWTKGRREQGIANLCWYRQLDADDAYIIEEIEMMDVQINDLPTGFIKPIRLALSNNAVLWRLFLGHMLFLLQNFSGINAIVRYTSPRPHLPPLTPLRTTTPLPSSAPWASTAPTQSTS